MRFVGPVRKDIGIRNIFNVLGPLTNPAFANLQVTGVYSEALVEPIARVFANLGVKRGYVFYGTDGMDWIVRIIRRGGFAAHQPGEQRGSGRCFVMNTRYVLNMN